MKKHPVLRNILIDLTCAALALVIFALFHHVLPRKQQELGIVISNPAQSEAASTDTITASVPEPTKAPSSASSENRPETTKAPSSASSDNRPGTSGTPSSDSSENRPGTSGTPSSGSSENRPGYSRKSRGPGRSGGGWNNAGGWNDAGSVMTGKGGSALTDDDTETVVETDETPISEKFADKYTDTVVITENSYSSPDISITVTEETYGRAIYYIADIYVRDITCFQTALADDTYGTGFRDSIDNMALLNNALLAVNGDYYGNTNEGVVIRNGVIYRANATDCDVCVLYYDGTMQVMSGSSFSAEEAVSRGAWQAWTFGPALLDTDGSVITAFDSTRRIISANPRTAIGYYEPGHYCLVVVDGRGESAGITLPDLSRLFADLGCVSAYNLDGGNSSVMVWQDEVINDPSGGGRESSDAVLIAEVNDHE